MRYLGFLEKNGNQKHRNFLGLIKDTNRTKIHTEKKQKNTITKAELTSNDEFESHEHDRSGGDAIVRHWTYWTEVKMCCNDCMLLRCRSVTHLRSRHTLYNNTHTDTENTPSNLTVSHFF